jgi:hypothetical protein
MGWCRRGSISTNPAIATASGPKAGLIDNMREQALACIDIARRAAWTRAIDPNQSTDAPLG